MSYKYTHFIPENTAPAGAQKIGVYDADGKKVCTIPLGALTPPNGEKLYSFGLLSDIHIYPPTESVWKSSQKFDNALTFLEEQGCVFCAHCGDFTQTGFTLDDSTTGLNTSQMEEYKRICDKHTIPVYGICGNHESITNKAEYAAKNQRELLIQYTGNDLYYTVEQGNDLFIFAGQPDWNVVVSSDELQWLSETLEANRNKRCFVFIHPYIEEDSGDPLDVRENSVFDNWGATNTKTFMDLMAQHPNAILFHGHSHTVYESQMLDRNANYTERNGFKSVHVPSLARPLIVNVDGTYYNDDTQSQGYIVDVYDDCVVLNGMDFIGNVPVPLGTLKIET